ncbi:MAG: MliC family protein [Alsobacter sp.]
MDLGSGKVVTLHQAPSADGGRYVDRAVTFWTKGRSATLIRDGTSETCATR